MRPSCYLTSLLLVGCLTTGCKEKAASSSDESGKPVKAWNRSQAVFQYKLLQAELALSDSGKPYLVLDAPRKKLEIRLKGVIAWDCPLQPDDGAWGEVENFVERFMGKDENLVRPVVERYLFGSQEKSPDSVLAVVSKALGVSEDLIQRQIPSRFQLHWSNKLILDVSTDVRAAPVSRFKNTMVQVSQLIARPFGEAHLKIKMNPDKAVTFWRAMQPGVPMLVIP